VERAGHKPILVISPPGRDVYVAFNHKFDNMVVASHDYGQSFLPPQKVNDDHLWWYANGGRTRRTGTCTSPSTARGACRDTAMTSPGLWRSLVAGSFWARTRGKRKWWALMAIGITWLTGAFAGVAERGGI
jgi:hypothetical protein